MHPRPEPAHRFSVLDLFSGCGGLSAGLEMASAHGTTFHCIGAIDNWPAACDSFSLNHSVSATCAEVSEFTADPILSKYGQVDVVAGGPPCQGFSTSGKRALDDPRNGLMKAYFDVVRLASPKAFLMENVSGFTTFQNGRILREIMDLASNLGYQVFPGILLASHFGVPQRRRRFILIGTRAGHFSFPGPQVPRLQDETLGLFGATAEPATQSALNVDQKYPHNDHFITFDQATGDLPEIESGQSADHYSSEPQNEFQQWARRDAPHQLMDHVAASHRAYFVEMMSYIPAGKSAMDEDVRGAMPQHLRPKSGFPNSYARIRGDLPAPTITRNFTTPSSANCIHPRRNRSLTIREGARCQSFPDRYRFSGSHGDRRLMIGNAVPPLLAKVIGTSLLDNLTATTHPLRTANETR